MSRTRLFVTAARLGGAHVTLTGDEHRHLARVLRARQGDAVTLFDGAGAEVDATIVRVGPRDAELALGARRAVASSAAAVAITLLVAVPRGERMDLVVQKTTELGVARVVPVVSARSVARPEAARAARWDKIAREAARQCGRADVPRVDAPVALAAALVEPDLPATRLALWEGERGRSLRAALAAGAFGAEAPGRQNPAVALLVGPEGGFSDDEVAAARAAGFVAVGLGPRILRVETAAIVGVALVQSAAGGLD
jgi:16S rRNA (uracil1498-N3)-methyltransferase